MTKAKKSAPLSLTIKIPAVAVPLLKGLAALSEQPLEQLAAHAVVAWLKSEDAMTLIDDEINVLLRED